MKLTFSNLESATWTTNSGPSIDSAIPLALSVSNLPTGELVFTNIGGGGLCSCKIPLPINGNIPISTLPYVGLDLQKFVPASSAPFLLRDENDVIVVQTKAPAPPATIANKYDFSAQRNGDIGWMWEIDNAQRTWSAMGYIEPLIAGVWTNHSMRAFMAPSAYSVLSIDGHLVPAAMQGLALQASDWAAVIIVQLQTKTAQAVTMIYKDITVTLSDQPF